MWEYRRGAKAKAKPITNVQGVFNAAQRVASTQGLTLKQKKGLKQPYTDLETKEVFVPEMNSYWTESQVMGWLGAVYHEIGHHAPEVQDTLPYLKKHNIDTSSHYGHLINMVDDYRNEFNGYEEWIGRDQALSHMQGEFAKSGLTDMRKWKEDGVEETPDMTTFVDALAWIYTQRANLQPDVAIPAAEWETERDVAKYYHLNDRLAAASTIEDVVSIVDDILEASDQDPEEQKQKAQQKSKGGEGEGDSDQQGQGEGRAKPGEGEGEQATDKVTVNYSDLLGHKHDSDRSKPDGESYLKINYDHEPDGNYQPYDKMLVKKAREIGSSSGLTNPLRRAYNHGSKLAASARRLFQAKSQTLVTHNHRAGRLDKRDLYRIPNGHVDVFTKKEAQRDYKNTAIFLLTDASGSMSGNKFTLTGASAALLNDAVSPLGIPLEIAAFTDSHHNGCEHYISKTFSEKRSAEDIIKDYDKISTKLHQNADGESILWAYGELMKRPEKRKILIVISDGMPAPDHYQDCYTYTKSVVKHIEGVVECYGIGVEDDAVKEFYKDYTVLNNASELESCLLNVVKEKLINQ